MKPALPPAFLDALRQLDSCAVSNAIERFKLRLRNEGVADATIRCCFPHFSPMVGYAVTARIRCSNPPPASESYIDRTDWWEEIQQIPAPRVFVIQDIDERPGLGAILGEVHASILKALGCTGAITNGAVRDLPAIEAARFHLFAGNVAVSHAYAHFVDFGGKVEIGGVKIQPGDLLHGDRHGFLLVPHSIAADVPALAAKMKEQEHRIIALCHSPGFSPAKLREAVEGYLSVATETQETQTRNHDES
ncbi:MAG: RraA family protein [Blastocatellia bacterium]|nr:RraA family protein [Blastocatellia bacterium]